ncbi:hypothetical protein NDN08_000562 [Rhodosorus marinus]|uniref:SET domain-containing protein n=1 Tax=Rhodosorus marinus TaxID=101924 RepID=A0AAV8USE6_9RHOD|nr:hypothetical protein NDN08_000562 [Rhodosorus marinus]
MLELLQRVMPWSWRVYPLPSAEIVSQVCTGKIWNSYQGLQQLVQEAVENRLEKAMSGRCHSKFALHVRPSTIPNAGNGVFLSGHADPGDLVALYAGVYFPPIPPENFASSHQYSAPVGRSITTIPLEEELYTINLEGGGCINAYDASNRIGRNHTDNPYAVGHMINHPQDRVVARVVPATFVWPDEYRKNAPNKLHDGAWFVDAATLRPVKIPEDLPLRGVALIASRTIEDGSEIFLRYNCKRPFPDWYTE